MNGQTLLEGVREDERTELDRLGSDKALLAATGADLERDTVLAIVARTLDGLTTTFEAWAEESRGQAAETFDGAAAAINDDYERVRAELDGNPAGDPPAPLPAVRTAETPAGRAGGGLVGHGLVFDGLLLQSVSFFVNEADREGADLFRDLRTATNRRIEDGTALLDAVCTDASDWERAETAAIEVVEAAYREYVETLGEMGIDPKPVC